MAEVLKNTEQHETPRPESKKKPLGGKQVNDALEYTRLFLADHPAEADETPEAYRTRVYTEIAGALEKQRDERVEEQWQDVESSIKMFISMGRQALESELGYIENDPTLKPEQKERDKDRLIRRYIKSRLVEKSTIVAITNHLLGRFLYPKANLEDLAESVGARKMENGEWVVNFDPDKHFASGSSEFVSEKSLGELQAAIALALKMKEMTMTLLNNNRDASGRPDAKAIIEQATGKTIKGRARVVEEGTISITIVLENEADYNLIYGSKDGTRLSGAFHDRFVIGTERAIGNKFMTVCSHERGLINICNGYTMTSIIAHENEHSLNEIFLHGRGKENFNLEKFLQEFPHLSPEEQSRVLDRYLEAELYGSFSHFADEAAAHVMHNQSLPTRGQRVDSYCTQIVADVMQTLTGTKVYEHHQITEERLSEMKSRLLAVIPDSAKSQTVGELWESKVMAVATKEKMTVLQKQIIEALAKLKYLYPNKPNIARALVARENPLKWGRIADRAENILDAGKIRSKKEENFESDEEQVLRLQKGAVWALLCELNPELTGSVVTEETIASRENVGESEMQFELPLGWHGLSKIRAYKDGQVESNHPKESVLESSQMFFITTDGQGNKRILNNQGQVVQVDGENVGYLEMENGTSLFVSPSGVFDEQCHNQLLIKFDRLEKVFTVGKRIFGLVRIKTPDKVERKVLVDNQGKVFGKEFKAVEDFLLEGGKIFMIVEMESGEIILVDENGETVIPDGYAVERFVGSADCQLVKCIKNNTAFLYDLSGQVCGNPKGYGAYSRFFDTKKVGGQICVCYREQTFVGGQLLENTTSEYQVGMFAGQVVHIEKAGDLDKLKNLSGDIVLEGYHNFIFFESEIEGAISFIFTKDSEGLIHFFDSNTGKEIGLNLTEDSKAGLSMVFLVEGEYFYRSRENSAEVILNDKGEIVFQTEFEMDPISLSGQMVIVEYKKGEQDGSKYLMCLYNLQGQRITSEIPVNNKEASGNIFQENGRSYVFKVVEEGEVTKVVKEEIKI